MIERRYKEGFFLGHQSIGKKLRAAGWGEGLYEARGWGCAYELFTGEKKENNGSIASLCSYMFNAFVS